MTLTLNACCKMSNKNVRKNRDKMQSFLSSGIKYKQDTPASLPVAKELVGRGKPLTPPPSHDGGGDAAVAGGIDSRQVHEEHNTVIHDHGDNHRGEHETACGPAVLLRGQEELIHHVLDPVPNVPLQALDTLHASHRRRTSESS